MKKAVIYARYSSDSQTEQSIEGQLRVCQEYVINEYESAIVKEAFTKYSQGYKAVAIAQIFKECGYRRKSGMLVDHKYLYFILHNKRYTGVVEHQGVIYDKIFPRIISDELWNTVNAINEENKLAPSRKKEIFDYILSGKLICGECKHKMGGESGTSHTGDIHYYYICLSRRKKRAICTTKAVLKQWLEDTVINATVKMLESTAAIHNVAQEIFNLHTKQVADNSALKLIEQKRKEAVKAQNNMIKAIEQGIITEATKSRLTELETLISQYDFDIAKEKARSYTFLTVEQIEMFLSRFVFENPSDMKVRKLIVNTFIREVILYPDRVVITYNFTDNPEHIKFTKEHVVKTEKEIETADKTAFSSLKGSYIYGSAAPRKRKLNQRCDLRFLSTHIRRRFMRHHVIGWLGWIGFALCILLLSKFVGRISKSKKFNALLRQVHKPFGIAVLIVGLAHGICAIFGRFHFSFAVVSGLILLALMFAIGMTYLFRKSLKSKWFLFHRILSILTAIMIVVHITITIGLRGC